MNFEKPRRYLETREQFSAVIDAVPGLTPEQKTSLKNQVMENEDLRNDLILLNGFLSANIEQEKKMVLELTERVKQYT